MTATVQAEVGPYITGGDVEHAVLDTLRLWLPSYLADGERKHDLEPGAVPEPRGWTVTGRSLEKFTSDQLPCVIVMAGGILSRPLAAGMPGALTGIWSLDVGVIFNAAWGQDSRTYAQLYIRAVSLIMLQRPLENLLSAVNFNGEQYDELDFSQTRTYSAALAAFTIEVDGILNKDGGPPPFVGPPDVPTSPFYPWGEVKETDIKVTNVPPPSEVDHE
jgi:hypothetical protein